MTQADYENAALRPHWFARKLPRRIDRDYLHAIQRRCETNCFDEFVAEAGLSLLEGEAGQVSAIVPEKHHLAYGCGLKGPNSSWEELIEIIRDCLGPRGLFEVAVGRLITCVISHDGRDSNKHAVIGLVRSSDCNVVWLTIQLRASRFTPEVAQRLLSSGELRDIVDCRFEETHLEPDYREFFKREHRTAYVLQMDSDPIQEIRLKVARYSEQLVVAWASL